MLLGLRQVIVIDGLFARQHALVKDTGNQNASRVHSIKDDVLAELQSAQARPYVVACPAYCRIIGEHPATFVKIANVALGLTLAPSPKCIRAYASDVRAGAFRKEKPGHELS